MTCFSNSIYNHTVWKPAPVKSFQFLPFEISRWDEKWIVTQEALECEGPLCIAMGADPSNHHTSPQRLIGHWRLEFMLQDPDVVEGKADVKPNRTLISTLTYLFASTLAQMHSHAGLAHTPHTPPAPRGDSWGTAACRERWFPRG